jgi:hypothetical protein
MNVVRAGKMVAGPTGLFAGLGFVYAATECATEHYRGKQDAVSGMIAGLATGGQRAACLPACLPALSAAMQAAISVTASNLQGQARQLAYLPLPCHMQLCPMPHAPCQPQVLPAAGAAAGAVKGSVPAAVGWGLLFAVGSVTADFFGQMAAMTFKDVKPSGPLEKPAASKALV